MTGRKFISSVEKAFKVFQNNVPNKKTRYTVSYVNKYGNRQKGSTGNMAFNATQYVTLLNGTIFYAKIYVDENIAPYVYYTNEKWISPKWKGHKNPNEGWVDKGMQEVVQSLGKSFEGTVRRIK